MDRPSWDSLEVCLDWDLARCKCLDHSEFSASGSDIVYPKRDAEFQCFLNLCNLTFRKQTQPINPESVRLDFTSKSVTNQSKVEKHLLQTHQSVLINIRPTTVTCYFESLCNVGVK